MTYCYLITNNQNLQKLTFWLVTSKSHLTALGLKSAEVDRAAKNARHQIRGEDKASRAQSHRLEQHGLAARIAAVTAGRLRRDQSAEGTDTARPQYESRFAGGKWRTLYAPHFPILGSVTVAVPLFILAANTTRIILINTPALYWVMTVLGLAGIAASAIDYRSGCGVSAVTVGVNSAWLSGYAVFELEALSNNLLVTNLDLFFVLASIIAGIGFIGNGLVVAHVLRSFQDRRRQIGTPLLVFLIFMAGGLAFLSISTGLVNQNLLWVAGVMFSAALLAELTGIVIASTRILRKTDSV